MSSSTLLITYIFVQPTSPAWYDSIFLSCISSVIDLTLSFPSLTVLSSEVLPRMRFNAVLASTLCSTAALLGQVRARDELDDLGADASSSVGSAASSATAAVKSLFTVSEQLQISCPPRCAKASPIAVTYQGALPGAIHRRLGLPVVTIAREESQGQDYGQVG